MRRLILTATGALIVGVAAGIAVPKLWHHRPQSLNECMMERMTGQPSTMFAIVFEFCQDQQKAAELKDADIWPGTRADDWKPVKEPNP